MISLSMQPADWKRVAVMVAGIGTMMLTTRCAQVRLTNPAHLPGAVPVAPPANLAAIDAAIDRCAQNVRPPHTVTWWLVDSIPPLVVNISVLRPGFELLGGWLKYHDAIILVRAATWPGLPMHQRIHSRKKWGGHDDDFVRCGVPSALP